MMATTAVRRSSDRVPLIRWAWACVLVYGASFGCADVDADVETRNREARTSSRQDPIAFQDVASVPHPDILIHRTSRIARSSPEVALTLTQRLVVDARGNIYVDDWSNPGVPMIESRGELIRIIGRQGGGPGEFRNIGDIDVLSDGNLLVYDPRSERITVFFPGGDSVMRTISVPHEPQGPRLRAIRVAGTADPIMVGEYASAYTLQNVRDQRRTVTVRTLSMAGTLLDSIMAFPYKENLVHVSGSGYSVTTKPFGRRGFIRAVGDRIYYGWTDTVGVRTYSLRGEFIGGFKAAYERASLTTEDVDRALSELEERWARQAFRESIPESWPAFEDLVADDRGRVWFGIIEEGGVTTRWDGFTPDGEYRGSLEFPPNFDLKVVRGNRAYGVRTDELDVPRIEVYGIEWAEQAEEAAP